jgi:hypothetical protein
VAKKSSTNLQKELLSALREIRAQLHDMNQKLEHLIRSNRKFYFTTDFSDSSNHEFKG